MTKRWKFAWWGRERGLLTVDLSVLLHTVAFSYTCSCRIHTDAMNNRCRKTSLTKYLPLTLLQGFEKGDSRFACERELETEQKLQYFDPHSYGRQHCVFLVLLMLNWRPIGPLCWVMAFFTASYQHLLWTTNSIGVPEGPLGWVWLSLPHPVYNSVRSPTGCNCLIYLAPNLCGPIRAQVRLASASSKSRSFSFGV